MNREEKIENKYEKKFQELVQMSETDPVLKEEVFSTLSKIKAAAEFIDLFTVKFLESEATFFHHILNPDNK